MNIKLLTVCLVVVALVFAGIALIQRDLTWLAGTVLCLSIGGLINTTPCDNRTIGTFLRAMIGMDKKP